MERFFGPRQQKTNARSRKAVLAPYWIYNASNEGFSNEIKNSDQWVRITSEIGSDSSRPSPSIRYANQAMYHQSSKTFYFHGGTEQKARQPLGTEARFGDLWSMTLQRWILLMPYLDTG